MNNWTNPAAGLAAIPLIVGVAGEAVALRIAAAAAAGGPNVDKLRQLGESTGPAVADLTGRAQTAVTVLGRSVDSYVAKGQAVGANVLNIPTAIWDRLSDAGRWALNQKFLDEALARGDRFQLVSNVKDAPEWSFFWREIQYLGSKGFSVLVDGSGIVPPGGWP